MELPSDRQRQILDFVTGHIAQYERPPTYREIGDALGMASIGHVHYHIDALSKKGLLTREENLSRSLRPTSAAGPRPRKRVHHASVRGLIAAGAPIQPISDPNDTLEFAGDAAAPGVFALRVSGTSLMGDLMADGDLVVISPSVAPLPGDLVLALLPGPSGARPAAIRRYFKASGTIRLQPPYHPSPPIYFSPEDIQLQGKVIALIRMP
jgi:repressor LexA